MADRVQEQEYSRAWISGFVFGLTVSAWLVAVGILAYLGWTHGG